MDEKTFNLTITYFFHAWQILMFYCLKDSGLSAANLSLSLRLTTISLYVIHVAYVVARKYHTLHQVRKRQADNEVVHWNPKLLFLQKYHKDEQVAYNGEDGNHEYRQ